MKKLIHLFVILFLSVVLSVNIKAQAPIRVVCVGNSITAGYKLGNVGQAWPNQLNLKLGGKYSVLNCGVSGSMMTKSSTSPYWGTGSFTNALNFNPQILIISLGTNDAGIWGSVKDYFKADYIAMIDSFISRSNGVKPAIYLCYPTPKFPTATTTQNTNIETGVMPIIKEISVLRNTYTIDYHAPLMNSSALFPDQLHPNAEGALMLSGIAFDSISKHQTIVPYVSVNGADSVQTDLVSLNVGDVLTFKPTLKNVGTWQWIGPNGFKSTLRNPTITNIQLSQGGSYSVYFTNSLGQRSVRNFMVSLNNCAVTITPNVQVGTAAVQVATSLTVNPGSILTFTPQVSPASETTWNWSGPNGFFSNSRQMIISYIGTQQAGDYTATYYNAAGCKGKVVYSIKVEGTRICPTLVPYLNNGSWVGASTVSPLFGSNVTFGPQPTEGNWSWRGPNNFKSSDREVTVSNVQVANVGTYWGVYTNNAGCKDSLSFVINCGASTITPYQNTNNTGWQQIASSTLNVGGNITIGPQPTTGGSWKWTGPNGFTSTVREFTLSNVQANQGGTYTATYTNDCGKTSTLAFVLTVTVPCTATTIIPYMNVNNAGMQSISSTSTALGGTVILSPQPTTGGSWSWKGPNAFTSTAREITISNIQVSQTGNYTATYTNTCGLISTKIFTINSLWTALIEAESYSNMSGVQTEACTEGGLDVTSIETGDFMNYDASAPTTGSYKLYYRVASPNTGGVLQLEPTDGGAALGTVDIPNTGAFQTFQTVSHTVNLVANAKLSIKANVGGWNLNWWGTSPIQSTGVFDLSSSEIRIYPNPADNIVRVTNVPANTSIIVSNLVGQVLLRTRSANVNVEVNVSNLKSGTYFMTVGNEKTFKLLKK